METRSLGRTGHDSSILTFGALALDWLTQAGADRAIELALACGINHFDVAPQYGSAEIKLGPKLREHREHVFLGCKTQERTYDGARASLERSLTRLGVDHIDLYQFHGLEYEHELETITGDDGALEAFRDARDEGLITHIGLTSHGHPRLIERAVDAIPAVETVMFPFNYTVMGNARENDEYDYERVLDVLRERGIGRLCIKAFAKGPWPENEDPDRTRPYATWYEPYDTFCEVSECLDFALSCGMDSVINPGDPKLLSAIFDAADGFTELTENEQRALIDRGREETSPVPAQLD